VAAGILETSQITRANVFRDLRGYRWSFCGIHFRSAQTVTGNAKGGNMQVKV
jgi:hypothetical protein